MHSLTISRLLRHTSKGSCTKRSPMDSLTAGRRCYSSVAASRTLGAATAAGLPQTKGLSVLGIETTCDETAIAFLSGKSVAAHSVASQWHLSSHFGGVVPHLAARQHRLNFPHVLHQAVVNAIKLPPGHMLSREEIISYVKNAVDVIAVATGPGLAPCLTAGLDAAKELAHECKLPLVGVNHLEAHFLVSRLENPNVQLPALVLLVSGGHTQLIYAFDVGKYAIMGTTYDDAVGESLDKVARILRLPGIERGSGGQAIERAALNGRHGAFKLPIPLTKNANAMCFDFSFAGVKSELRRELRRLELASSTSNRVAAELSPEAAAKVLPKDLSHTSTKSASGLPSLRDLLAPESAILKPSVGPNADISMWVTAAEETREDVPAYLTPQLQADMSLAFQEVAVRHLSTQTARALDWIRKNRSLPYPQSLIVCGGVAANSSLRSELGRLARQARLPLYRPSVSACTDNAVMIAWTAAEHIAKSGSVPAYSEEAVKELKPTIPWPVGPPLFVPTIEPTNGRPPMINKRTPKMSPEVRESAETKKTVKEGTQ